MGYSRPMKLVSQQANPSEKVQTKKKTASLALGAAAFLGTFSGVLPLTCPLNVLVVLILACFRIHFLSFLFFFGIAQLLSYRYLGAPLNAWGLDILTSPETIDFARRVTQAPILCYLRLNDTRACGGILLGLPTGAVIGLLVAALAHRFRKAPKPQETPKP